jgi:plasmid stabilization system protein ParE
LRKLEYSQISRRKLKELRDDLSEKYGVQFAKDTIKVMTKSVRMLEHYANSGIQISKMYGIDTNYWYLFVNHNYFVYRIEDEKVIVVQIFNEKEDFIQKLFGISGRTQDSIDYWGE